ncbi:MAG: PIN domain-containing protein [Alphaproteobacteria bacterium]
MRAALGSNVLVYAMGVNGDTHRRSALSVLDALPDDGIMLPAQAMGEVFNVLVRKAGWTRHRARSAVQDWRDAYPVIDTTADIVVMAMDLSVEHRLGVWDSVILSAASAGGCRVLLSQDLQSGFTWGGVTVVDPFSAVPHALLEALYARRPSA